MPSTRTQTRGYLLTRARETRGWTQAGMADRLRRLSIKHGRALATGRDGISHWEHRRTPDLPTQRLIAELLGIPAALVRERPWPQWLAEDPAQQPPTRPWTLSGAAQALNDLSGATMDVTRRELVLISGGTLTASLLGWLTADPVAAGQITTGHRIGEAAVARIEARATILRRTDDSDGGGTILAETSSTLSLVNTLLRHRTHSTPHRDRLYAAASDLARQRAAATLDIHGESADATFDTALRTAHAAGDDALGAHVLCFWAVSAYNTGRPQDAETMAAAGLTAVRGRCTPRVEAMLTARRGRARAHLGDLRCWEDFDRAEELLTTAEGHEDPQWAYWFDLAELLGARGSSHRDLGQAAPAAQQFAAASKLFPGTHTRTHALYLARQAGAHLDENEVEQATGTAERALDLVEGISSQRSTGPLLNLAQRMGTYTETSAKNFSERAHAALAA